ncbi:hypothetical protein KPC83_02925 [Collinsella sp. zg1085]|uniref:hypothetical protein n=1 Tax=Collinsella sp. zg1085 TaxID=2844380 RepID=UPI001C0D25F7|nr:hypothetical protein [Collinsella sp. zg1085]QWT18098.1 hypothetical protein KPC83_02925 [Collinsella sp. zg1085]
MDLERMVALHLEQALGVNVMLEVARERPDEFILVEQTGAVGTRFVRRIGFAIQAWAHSRRRAYELISKVEDVVFDLMDEPVVFGVELGSTYRWADPESRQERYQTSIQITICK